MRRRRSTGAVGHGRLAGDAGLRLIAARGWTTPDGTHTRIYLLRFGTAAVVDELHTMQLAPYDRPAYAVRGPDCFPDRPVHLESVSISPATVLGMLK